MLLIARSSWPRRGGHLTLRTLGVGLVLTGSLSTGFVLGMRFRQATPRPGASGFIAPRAPIQAPVVEIPTEPSRQTRPQTPAAEPQPTAEQPEAVAQEGADAGASQDAAPDAATLTPEAIAQQVQRSADQLGALNQQLRDAETPLRETRQELGRLRSISERAEGQLRATLRSLPGVRQGYQQQAHDLIDRFQQTQDAYSAGYLAASLAQYEAKVADWEAALHAHGATLEAAVRSLPDLIQLVETSWETGYRLRLELSNRAGQLDRFRALTAWDAAFEQAAAELEQTTARIGSLTESVTAAQSQLEARRQELAAAEAAVAGWTEFQQQSVQSLAGWR